MNRNDELPEDAVPKRDHFPDSGTFAEIERLLKSARPRSPQLDLAAIERLAREVPTPTACPSREGDSHVVLRRRTSGHGLRRRLFAALAGSWICGALVGAICMFWYEGSSAPATGHSPPPVQLAKDSTRVAPLDPHATSPSVKEPLNVNMSVAPHATYAALSDIDSLLVWGLLDLNGSIGSRPERPSGTLRARMHWSSLAENFGRARGQMNSQQDAPKDEDDVRTPNEWRLPLQNSFRESPPVTRERLLRELQGDMARNYL